MSETHPFRRQGTLLNEMLRLIEDRAREESKTAVGYASATEAAESEFREARQAIEAKHKAEAEGEEARYRQAHARLLAQDKAERSAAQEEHRKLKATIVHKLESGRASAKKGAESDRWQGLAVYESAKDAAKARFEKMGREVAVEMAAFEDLAFNARARLEAVRGLAGPVPEPEPAAVELGPDDNPVDRLREAIGRASERFQDLNRLSLPGLVRWQVFAVLILLLAVGLAAGGWFAIGGTVGAVVGGLAGLALGIGLRFWLASIARRQVGRSHGPLVQALAEVESWAKRCREQADADLQRTKAEMEAKLEGEKQRIGASLKERLAELQERHDLDDRQADQRLEHRSAKAEKAREEGLRLLNEAHERDAAAIKARFEEASRELVEKHRLRTSTSKANYEKVWDALSETWSAGLGRVKAEVEANGLEDERLFPDWNAPDWKERPAPNRVPPALRFGSFQVDLGQIPQGVPNDPRLKDAVPPPFRLPATTPFPTRGSLLIKAAGPGRDRANQLLQAIMLRCLTALPPGKVRFTIVDPVGLGQNFSAFMHLADYDEQLVTSRIWTEPQQIEQRLADLTDHMENVIQKYLRNEFETIEAYNDHAGEVAEPFRFLVIANFPVNFDEAAARRLLSIAASGPRCGVYVLISVDTQQGIPPGFDIRDLEQHCTTLVWKDQKFLWRGSEFEKYPLMLDAPPPAEVFNRVMHEVGARAKAAKRVEVPFDFIAPKPEKYWTSDSAKGIDVALGRAGATRLQNLKLGKGTAQHVLIAGRTGSGKSTLLHALITNLALHYGPDQVELYLIDFKKGVEFKTYATHELPHARVVAVESEREFGLSVLQRLDVELRERGDKFRAVGAQDLAAYRAAEPKAHSPRILLIVDEFQEFFVEDDKVAQDCALLLDRLVRQGRAFGIHVHLGSQTLGGAFSLARSTLGQMAVRIALQCSEADAHLILSEDNAAARLLSRPGEAIYNDANGMVEGNNFFQVVWLSDERKEEYLRHLHKMATERGQIRPQIVFEGNVPADPAKNDGLGQLLQAPSWPEMPRFARAWLGEAIAIKDPTDATFRPQGGSNLLIIGQQDEAALGMLTTALIGLAAQYPPDGARFYLFDGSPVDSPNAGVLGRVGETIPHSSRSVGWRDLPGVMTEIAEEVERRQADSGSEGPALYLLIYDLQRFRDLRKSDDDFGGGFGSFGSGEAPKPTPPKQFASVLREGPPVNVYTMAWCDSLNNVNRTLDRQALREFEMRVLFQMGATDSSNLIDSPAANRLGENRALYYSEEQGLLEKFRPYGVPTPDWLARVRDLMNDKPAPEGREPLGVDASTGNPDDLAPGD